MITLKLLCLSFFSSISLISAAPNRDLSSFIREANDTTLESDFDYIIVGGGTTGCALAATLSESYRVLVLERGGTPYDNPNLTRVENIGVNFVYPGGLDAPNQAFVSEDGVPSIRGNVLGGGSSINGGVYSRAPTEFFTASNLQEELVNASYAWVENVVAHNPTVNSQFDSSVRNALLEVGLKPGYGATYEYVTGTKTAGTIFDSSGVRHPASDLLLAYANRENILVLLHATVDKVLFHQTGGHTQGVSYTDMLGQYHTARLSSNPGSEVIISAGALGSPQLLMLSGIGPRADLESLGIEAIADVPRVGKGMGDNPMKVIAVLSRLRVGRMAQHIIGVSSQANFSVGAYGVNDSFGVIFEEVSVPLSTGELWLVSKNGNETPRVRFNYFDNPVDLEQCVNGVNMLEEMILSESMEALRFENESLPSGGTVASPDRRNATLVASGVVNRTIAEFCERKVSTNYHYHGGCRLGEVVDGEYKVMGFEGLRVVDSSTFKSTPGTNPQATVMMLGRYVGVKVLETRKLQSTATSYEHNL